MRIPVVLLTFIFAFGILALECQRTSAQTTMVKNVIGALGDFEWDSHQLGVGDSWIAKSASGGAIGSYSLDPTRHTTGHSSQKMSLGGSTAYGSLRVYRDIVIGPRRQYGDLLIQPADPITLSADLMATNLKGARAVLYAQFYYISPSGQWNEIPESLGGRQYLVNGNLPSDGTWHHYRTDTFTLPAWTDGSKANWMLLNCLLIADGPGASGELNLDNMVVDSGQTWTPGAKPVRFIKTYAYVQDDPDPCVTANRYDLIVLPPYRHDDVHNIKLYNPNARVFVYMALNVIPSNSSPTYESNAPFNYAWVSANHPEWILRDINGEPILDRGAYPSMSYVLNHGLPDYAPEWAKAVRELVEARGFDGVLIDGPAISRSWLFYGNPMPMCPAFPDDATWNDANTSFMAQVGHRLSNEGIQVVCNLGESNWGAAPPKVWISFVDGGEEEYAFTFTGAQAPMSFNEWKTQLTNPQNGNRSCQKIYLVQGHAGSDADIQRQLYGLVSAALITDPNTYFHSQVGRSRNARYDSTCEMRLGTPAGPMAVIQGSLYTRDYTNGRIYLNASQSLTYSIVLSNTYQVKSPTMDGILPAGTAIKLGPQMACVMEKLS